MHSTTIKRTHIQLFDLVDVDVARTVEYEWLCERLKKKQAINYENWCCVCSCQLVVVLNNTFLFVFFLGLPPGRRDIWFVCGKGKLD